MILRKMIKTKGLIACLLVGLILTVALISGIPIYTNGVFQRMLTKDLENFQVETGEFPGLYKIKVRLFPFYRNDIVGAFNRFDERIGRSLRPQIRIPDMSHTQKLSFGYVEMRRTDEAMRGSAALPITLDALSNLENHVDVKHGRMFSSELQDDVFEVMVSELAMKELKLLLGEEYEIAINFESGGESIRVRVVGVYARAPIDDGFWFEEAFIFEQSLLIDYNLFVREFVDANPDMTREGLTDAIWYYALDYGEISATGLDGILTAIEKQIRDAKDIIGADLSIPMLPILEQYNERAKRLQTILWFVQIPVLIILAFYLYMVSSLIIMQEKNEIALLKSRGASTFQICTTYLGESAILGAVAMIVGPFVGYAVCTFIGFSSGFMQFVQRGKLPIALNGSAYLYSLIAVVFSIITIVLPAIFAARTTIVKHKQQLAKPNKPIWRRYYLDVAVLAIVFYGYASYKRQQSILFITGADAGELPIDPLLFVISTLFIFGAGVLLLRLIPLILKGIFLITKKILTPAFYAALIQVSRSRGQEQYLLLFLVLTFATGIYSANTARTINQNTKEQILYRVGTDMIINPYWQGEGKGGGADQASMDQPMGGTAISYREPPEELYADLAGTESQTKVLHKDRVRLFFGSQEAFSSELLAVVPHEFAKTAWFRSDLTNPHWYSYLNVLSDSPTSVLASTSLAEEYGVLLGDTVSITWAGQNAFTATIGGFFEYWPSFIPYRDRFAQELPVMIVANLAYVQERTALEPYEIWIKKTNGATSATIFDDLADRDILLTDLTDANEQMIKKLNDPLLQGMNGALTLNFLVIVMISVLGFAIFWILSLRSRALQFGVLRAIGLSRRGVILTVFSEQLFLAGLGILFGFLCGELTSALFVPLLQLTTNVDQQVPPFQIVAALNDYAKLYVIAGAIVAFGLGLIMFFINHIKVAESLKLGEE
jgi:putative ABC transport system permease protein